MEETVLCTLLHRIYPLSLLGIYADEFLFWFVKGVLYILIGCACAAPRGAAPSAAAGTRLAPSEASWMFCQEMV